MTDSPGDRSGLDLVTHSDIVIFRKNKVLILAPEVIRLSQLENTSVKIMLYRFISKYLIKTMLDGIITPENDSKPKLVAPCVIVVVTDMIQCRLLTRIEDQSNYQ